MAQNFFLGRCGFGRDFFPSYLRLLWVFVVTFSFSTMQFYRFCSLSTVPLQVLSRGSPYVFPQFSVFSLLLLLFLSLLLLLLLPCGVSLREVVNETIIKKMA